MDFDFGDTNFSGRMYFGLYQPPGETKYAYPLYSRRSVPIDSGRCSVPIASTLKGKYDFTGWQVSGRLHVGYRIVSSEGSLLYDGRLRLTGTGPFQLDTCVIEGPFVNLLTHQSVVVSFVTNFPVKASVAIGKRTHQSDDISTHHEITVNRLEPDRDYTYAVMVDDYREEYSFHTAPLPGSRTSFTFAYASDGRANSGGGERDIWGVNAYMLKRIAVMLSEQGARFFQFTGDLIDGYTNDVGDIQLQYANWKRTAEPFAAHLPFVCGFGNHETLVDYFATDKRSVAIDKFPYDRYSSEAIFARNFVNPLNGPFSEDGSVYDPHPETIDFPPYEESAFYYIYDNVAMISLNSNYWYAYTINREPGSGGNPHAYIMDNQLKWLSDVVDHMEANAEIDHIFVTVHTPLFPNGGHVGDDMWYQGNNEIRPWINGEPVKKGIIERRDEILDILVNRSTKVRAALTGDEHNYSRLPVGPGLPMYPEGWDLPRLKLSRGIYQVNNGAAGAPYYGREHTPWERQVQRLSTQNAVVFFHIDGISIDVEVRNPDTSELIDQFTLYDGE